MDYCVTNVHLPKELKRHAFALLALADTSFSAWVRQHLQEWVEAQGGVIIGKVKESPEKAGKDV